MVETCPAFLYRTVCSRFDQDGYRVICRLEALLSDHEPNLDLFDDVLSLFWTGLDHDHMATKLHDLQSHIPG